MKSMFEEPRPVELSKQWSFIDTYGAFFVHCGAMSMGCPMEADNHPVRSNVALDDTSRGHACVLAQH